MTNFSAFKKILWMLFSRPKEGFLAIGLIMVLSLVGLPLPFFMAILIDVIIPSNDLTALIVVGSFLFCIRTGASFFQVFQNYLIAQIVGHIGLDLRKRILYRMLRLPFVRYIGGEVNGMVTRLAVDTERVEGSVQETINFFFRPTFSFLFIFTTMLIWNSSLALYSLIVVPTVVFTTRAVRNKLEESSRKQRTITEELEQDAAEAFSSIRTVKAYNGSDYLFDRINQSTEKISKSSVSYAFWTQFSNDLIALLSSMSLLGFIYFAGHQVFSGVLTIGGFVALQRLSEEIRSPISQLMYFFTSLSGKKIAIERVDEVENSELEQKDIAYSPLPKRLSGLIEFCDVSLSYVKDQPVLKNLDLKINPGETVALVGPSGSGKSSIANLALGLYVPNDGCIRYDGRDIHLSSFRELRSQIGVVYQDAILFNNTIRYNLCVGLEAQKEFSDTELENALKKAEAWSFVSRLPKQLDTVIGVNGIKLSGGQKQRLSIARAIVSNPTVMILDEATSSLDSETELAIQESLDEILKERTSIIIAHRLSTIVNADRILVLDNGKVVQDGSHGELLSKGEDLYYQLYTTQTEGLINTRDV